MKPKLIKENLISVVCYDRIESWHSRKKALSFYGKAARVCEGCERDRYFEVCCDLEDGLPVCHDKVSRSYDELAKENRFYKTTAPDGSRDYGGKIYYQKN